MHDTIAHQKSGYHPTDANDVLVDAFPSRGESITHGQVNTSGDQSPPRMRTPRYTVLNGQKIQASVEFILGDDGFELPIQLIDLSTLGAKFATQLHLTAGTEIRLTIRVPKDGLEIVVNGHVRWSQPCSQTLFQAGCAFSSVVCNDELQRLASCGYLERRLETRVTIALDAIVREELAGSTGSAATIIDYSQGGLRLFSAIPKRVGQRLLLEVDDPHDKKTTLSVRALWQNEVEDGFQTGCCFLGKSGFETIQRCLCDEASDRRTKLALRLGAVGICPSFVWRFGIIIIIAICCVRIMTSQQVPRFLQDSPFVRHMIWLVEDWLARLLA